MSDKDFKTFADRLRSFCHELSTESHRSRSKPTIWRTLLKGNAPSMSSIINYNQINPLTKEVFDKAIQATKPVNEIPIRPIVGLPENVIILADISPLELSSKIDGDKVIVTAKQEIRYMSVIMLGNERKIVD